MEHEMPPPSLSVDLTTAVSNGDKKTYSPPRLIPLAMTDVKSDQNGFIAETCGGLLSSHAQSTNFRNIRVLLGPNGEYGGYGWTRTTDISIMNAAL